MNKYENNAYTYDQVIVLRSSRGPVGSKVIINPCKMPNGAYPDHIRRVNASGDIIFRDGDDKKDIDTLIPVNAEIVIESGTAFDLSNPRDKARWEAIKYCPLIAPARNAKDANGNYLIDGSGSGKNYQHEYKRDFRARYGIAEFYIERPYEEVSNKISAKEYIHKAMTWVIQDTEQGRKKMCKILGKNLNNFSDADVKEYLFELCQSMPTKIIELYTGTDTNLRLMFVDALENNVIVYKDKLYFYNDILLGASQDTVITFFKDVKNRTVIELIKADLLPESLKDISNNTLESIAEQKAQKEEKIKKSK